MLESAGPTGKMSPLMSVRETDGIGKCQVRDCLEKLSVFKTLDQIRFMCGCRKG